MESTTDDGYSPSSEESSNGDVIDDIVTDRSNTGPSTAGGRSSGSKSDGRHISASRSLSKKRKPENSEEFKPRSKKLRQTAYNDYYRKLLNEMISDVDSGVSLDEYEFLPPSQIGLVTWSSQEKDDFFVTLGRKGIHNLWGIQNAIPTKAIPEIHVFLQSLQQARMERHLHNRHHELPELSDIPAAFEVSYDCELALTQAADALSSRQFDHESKTERKRYPKLWLLDRKTLEDLDESTEETENVKFSTAKELLNLGNFLELSERIFMNSNNSEGNWRCYAKEGEHPSIFCTAFLDFHGLLVSITKRLVQSAVFFAMSRLRASNTDKYTYNRDVRKCDIAAALGVLGMKSNANDYWAEVTTRCNLDVYEKIMRGKPQGKRLSYSEVEKVLRTAAANEDITSISSEDSKDEPILQESNTTDSPDISSSDYAASSQIFSSSADIRTISDNDTDLLPIQSPQAKKQLRYIQELAELQDAYAEALDQSASQQEEVCLWKILGKEPPQRLKPEEMELPKRPIVQRKLQEDLVGWRDWTEYRSPWERYETPVPIGSFRRNRRWERKLRARKKSKSGKMIADKGVEDEESHGDDEGNKDESSHPLLLKRLGSGAKTKVFEEHQQSSNEAISNQDNSSENGDPLQNSDDAVSSRGDSSENEETLQNKQSSATGQLPRDLDDVKRAHSSMSSTEDYNSGAYGMEVQEVASNGRPKRGSGEESPLLSEAEASDSASVVDYSDEDSTS